MATKEELEVLASIRDEDVYEYRRQKELKQRKLSNDLREGDSSVKRSVRTSIGWVDIYLYFPKEVTCNATVFNFHGGGFCLGYWELDIPYCRLLADRSGAVVVNVDYVLAPEYKYPLTYTVTYEVLAWCQEHADELGIPAGHFLVCGSSAGANISAGMVQLAQRDGRVGIDGLIMNYPALRMQLEGRKAIDPSKAIAPKRMLQYMKWQYADLGQMSEPLASPVNAGPDVVWPDTLINVAGFDSLKPETDDFRDKLEAQGTRVDYKCYPQAQHGFTHKNLKEYREDDAMDAWGRIADFIRAH